MLKNIIVRTWINCLVSMKNFPVFVAGCLKEICFWDMNTVGFIRSINGHNDQILCLTFTSDEKILVSGSKDKSIRVWEMEHKTKPKILNGHLEPVLSVAISKDDQFLVSGSEDRSVRLWSLTSFVQYHRFLVHSDKVSSILHFGDIFMSLSRDSSIGYIDIQLKSLEKKFPFKPFKAESESFLPGNNFVIYTSQDTGFVWNLEKSTEEKILKGHKTTLCFIEVSKDMKWALTGSRGSSDNLCYWDLQTSQPVAFLNGHSGDVFCADFSKGADFAASGSSDATVKIWGLANRELRYELKGHAAAVYSVKLFSNEQFLVSGGADKQVIVWRIFQEDQYATFLTNQKISKVFVVGEGRFVVSVGFFEGIRVWNLKEKRQEWGFEKFEDAKEWLENNAICPDYLRRFLI